MVKGRALVLNAATVVTPYGRATCAGECEALFDRTENEVTIDALTEGWTLTRTGETEARTIPPATTVRVGQVTRDGRAAVTAPTTRAWADLITRWAKLYPDGGEAFTERAHEFREAYDDAVATLSARDQSRAVAMITAHQTEESNRAAKIRAAADEDARLRKLFRERNYVE